MSFVYRYILALFAGILFLGSGFSALGQPAQPTSLYATGQSGDLFGTRQTFIENAGQYGGPLAGSPEWGKPLFGFEGFGMPVLFTTKGMVYLHRKLEGPSEKEREEREASERRDKNKRKPEDEWEEQEVTDRQLTMEWVGASSDVEVIGEDPVTNYFTYGSISKPAHGYRKLTYRGLYPGIDVVFTFRPDRVPGFEYSIIVHPGANPEHVRMKWGGDLKSIRSDGRGGITARSSIDGVAQTAPVALYGADGNNAAKAAPVQAKFQLSNHELGFQLPAGYDSSRTLVIDPFVTNTGNLTGLNAGKAKDVDFDYAGNVYVTGGGSGTVHQLSKFNAAGVLQWTFNGSLTVPSWTFGTYWGGWMVEKPTGNIYLGQGFNPGTGFQVIRVSTTGLYDNFITAANPNFREAWKMYWSCNNGSPQILVAGGGTNSNINFGVFTPPSTAIGALNVTGIPYTGAAGWAQDIVDFIIDPANNDMYTIYGSLIGNPSLTNKIYKNSFPYSSASVAWNVASGFTAVQEIANRPYLAGGTIDNSANLFAINGSYLYYWDGKNLKAFNKASGAGVGAPLTTANTLLMQGGIVADACNHVFVGDGNGVIKVYQFNGTGFDDAAAADISIPGFAGHAVYDLGYDESRKLLYASGDGFVASFDVSAYCPTTLYTVVTVPDCQNSGVTASLTPAPPAGSTVTWSIYNGTTQIATNQTGVFTGLTPNTTYTIVATINLACSGTQATGSFLLPGPAVTTNVTPTTCGNSTGSINVTATGGTAPYTYSINGVNFQAGNSFTNLPGGVYTVTVKDAGGCQTTATVTVLNSNGPILSFAATQAECGSNNGTITASVTGGTAPYSFIINGGAYQANNFFTGLSAGTYTLTVKDAANCTNAVVVTITATPAPLLTAIPASATCGNNNGSITAFGSGGTGALSYSINGNTFQNAPVFTSLSPGNYTVTVRDVNGCAATASVTVGNAPPPTVTAAATNATCNNSNGTITATGNAGIAPYTYSINGGAYQSFNIFTGLAPGVYTLSVKDAVGCVNTTTITVTATNAPVATATSTVSACNASTGTITIAASGGAAPYTYSINGINFQAGNAFTGLAPGNYVAYVRDVAGCVGTVLIAVGNTAGPALSVAVTPTACNASTGTITANGSGGTAPLAYSLDGITYQAGNTFTGLATGSYTVYVKDANGCTRALITTVANLSGLSLTASSISSACNGTSGTITLVATGGAAPLQYSINGVTYQASNVFTGVAPGSYTVYVKDNANCVVSRPVTVLAATGPTLTLSALQQATCGNANGVVRAQPSGGTAPYTYSLDGGAFQANNIFINLSAAAHTVVVKDAVGCTATATITITNSVTGTAPTDVTFTVRDALPCTGQSGRIKNLKGVPTGGGNNYTFSLDGGAFTTANQFTNVPPGLHVVTAKNNAGCTISKLVTIGSGTPATATAVATAANCNTLNGSITITGVGINTPYHASIDNGATWNTFFPPGVNSFTFPGLAPGTYNIIMADDADFTAGPPDIPGACLTTISVVVPSTGGPAVTATQLNGSCGNPNGSITATGSGGVPPYSYSINGGAYFPSGVFNNLGPGSYAVSVQDATGCTNGITVTLVNQTGPSLTATVQSPTCGLSNGSVTLAATGGTLPIEYSINGTTFQTSNVFSGLAPGNYTIYAKDATACYSTINVTLVAVTIPLVTAFTIAASCNNADGSLVASGTGGTQPYTYSIDGTVFQSSGTFANLAAGSYTITIRDASDCEATALINLPNQANLTLNLAATPANCNNASGTITATAAGGTAPLSYSIDGVQFQAGANFTGLLPGTYSIFVRDAGGCQISKTILVTNVPGPQTLGAAIVHAACGNANGSVTAAASGGTAPLQYSLDGANFQVSNTFVNIAAGTYTLTVRDANGCILTSPVIVANLAGPVISLSPSSATCGLSDGTITVNATGGTGVLTYSINGGTSFQASNIFLGLAAGNYSVIVKDARGCISPAAPATVGTIGSVVTPVFNPVAPICAGATLAPLPTTSLNNITGTWSPALNNTATTTYTFTPAAGQCATTTTMTIVVNPNVVPLFNPLTPVCAGAVLAALPTTSLNNITGTWSPALNNTTTTTYTFTPTAGQCATTTTLTQVINPKPGPIIIYHN